MITSLGKRKLVIFLWIGNMCDVSRGYSVFLLAVIVRLYSLIVTLPVQFPSQLTAIAVTMSLRRRGYVEATLKRRCVLAGLL